MSRMPETLRNLPIPSNGDMLPFEGRVFRWPRTPPEDRVSSSLLAAVSAYIESQGGGEGLFPTQIGSVNILRSFEARMPMRQVYKPSVCVVLQGAKEIIFGDDTLRYGSMECLVVSLDLPASGRVVEASPGAPYVGITIDLDLVVMKEVLEQFEAPPAPTSDSGPCLFVAQVEEQLADCVLRLIRMNETPKAIPVLYPSVMREILYWLLSGPHGGELCKLALPESNSDRVAKAVYLLHSDFARTLRVEQLAEAAHMSPSSFHQHFKALTSMTPLQYQKQLRLLEARRLMVTEAVNVAEAAYQVGYESASQFSREYTRMFGAAPKGDVTNLRRLYAQYTSRHAQSV